MKYKIIFTGIFLMLSLLTFSQTSPLIKVYAYAQSTLPGIKPGVSTNEKLRQPARENVNYYFYAEYLNNENFTAITLWVKGNPYLVKTDSIKHSPVETTGNDSKKITLVPVTSNKLLLLQPGSILNSKPTASLQKMMKKAELVITYRWKGKIKYYPVYKIKMLEVVAGV